MLCGSTISMLNPSKLTISSSSQSPVRSGERGILKTHSSQISGLKRGNLNFRANWVKFDHAQLAERQAFFALFEGVRCRLIDVRKSL